MHAIRKKRLYRLFIISLPAILGVSLVLYALKNNMSYFYTPKELVTIKLSDKSYITLGGKVKLGSLSYNKQSATYFFEVEDDKAVVQVNYHGIVPDLFREGQGVVVKGRLENYQKFNAEIVLTKHDEYYRPKT